MTGVNREQNARAEVRRAEETLCTSASGTSTESVLPFSGMSPDAREKSPLPKFRAVLPAELESVDLEQSDVQVEPEPFDQWAARLDDRLEALEAE